MIVNPLDLALFAVLPYVAIVLFLVGTIQRYREQAFSYSSLSSQFLENRQHFWGLVPFHYGLIAILAGHVIGFLIPRGVLAWNGHPLRLYVLEVAALSFALLILIGLVQIIWRRAGDARIRVVTSVTDWVLLAMLLIQVCAGIGTAVTYSWGSGWFAAALAPYLWSLVSFQPDLAVVSNMPWLVKVHIAGAFAITAFFPYTRMVHQLVFPAPYLWRRPQIVRWLGRGRGAA